MSACVHIPVNDMDPSTEYIRKNTTEYTDRLGFSGTTQTDVDAAVTSLLLGKKNLNGYIYYNICDLDQLFPIPDNEETAAVPTTGVPPYLHKTWGLC